MSKRSPGLIISYAERFSSDDEGAASKPVPSREIPAMPTPDSGAENAIVQKRRGRPPAAGKASAAKTSSIRSMRTSAGKKLGVKRAGVEKRTTGSKRPALKEITNARQGSDIEEVDDFDVLPDANAPIVAQLESPVAPQPASKKGRAGKTEATVEKVKPRRGRAPAIAAAESLEIRVIPETQQEEEEIVVQSKLARTKSAATKKPRPAKREVIPETQPEPMEIEETSPSQQVPEPIEEPTPKARRYALDRAPSATTQRRAPSAQRRPGSGSDTERHGNDPSLRRKVGDLTKKLEALEVKYNALRDIGVEDAETAFDKLKKQTDEKTKAANDLISALRADLKAQTALAAESTSLRAALATLTTTNNSLITSNKTLQATLQEAQNEAKSLQAKLTAVRASSASIQSIESGGNRVPGSAVKGGHGVERGQRTVLVGSAEAAREAQKRVLKEELYSDLTGLILRDVKRKEEQGEDVYDCIQTGRNGTLHFHLTLSNPPPTNASTTTTTTPGPASSATTAYEDAEFQYTPLLDTSRDGDLIEILPDYLTEEICFPRSNAAKFYARVVDCLTKRLVEVEEEEGEE